jgi:hypothetical protein
MRRLMSVIQDRHGTYYVQKKVPTRLQEAVARVLSDDKPRRVFLKKSLGTKSLKEANAAATHVLTEFNRIIAQAEALLKNSPSSRHSAIRRSSAWPKATTRPCWPMTR